MASENEKQPKNQENTGLKFEDLINENLTEFGHLFLGTNDFEVDLLTV